MGRFDEWFTDDVGQKETTADDSTQTEAAAETETDEASPAKADYSVFDESTAAESADSTGSGADGGTEAAIDDDVASLPSSLATREQSNTLKTRYNGHKALNDQIREDWMLIIESSPDAFQALLYRPDVGTYGVISDDTGEESFTELDNNQRVLTYQEPEIVYVLDNPDGRESFRAVDADGEQDGMTDDVLVLRIADNKVPVGSILEWNEEIVNGVARRWWYVHRIFSYGTQHVGSLYYCIPARNFDTTGEGIVQ